MFTGWFSNIIARSRERQPIEKKQPMIGVAMIRCSSKLRRGTLRARRSAIGIWLALLILIQSSDGIFDLARSPFLTVRWKCYYIILANGRCGLCVFLDCRHVQSAALRVSNPCRFLSRVIRTDELRGARCLGLSQRPSRNCQAGLRHLRERTCWASAGLLLFNAGMTSVFFVSLIVLS